jgi:hypothetical protein
MPERTERHVRKVPLSGVQPNSTIRRSAFSMRRARAIGGNILLLRFNDFSADDRFRRRFLRWLIRAAEASLSISLSVVDTGPGRTITAGWKRRPYGIVSPFGGNAASGEGPPDDTFSGHLEFALKWEGVDLGVLAALFKVVTDDEIAAAVRSKPTGAYAGRPWYLHDSLTGRRLDIPDPGKVKAIAVVDPAKQFAIASGFRPGTKRSTTCRARARSARW